MICREELFDSAYTNSAKPITLPEPRQIRPVDRQRVASFKSLRDRCRQGPFHAILGDNARVGKDRKPRNSDFFFKLSYQSTFPRKAPQYLPRFQTRRYSEINVNFQEASITY